MKTNRNNWKQVETSENEQKQVDTIRNMWKQVETSGNMQKHVETSRNYWKQVEIVGNSVNKKVQLDATICRHLFTASRNFLFTLSHDAWNHEFKSWRQV